MFILYDEICIKKKKKMFLKILSYIIVNMIMSETSKIILILKGFQQGS
jgi:hypothetical protein